MSKYFCLFLLALGTIGAMAGEESAKKDASHPALLDPSKANETAPAEYRVKFETTKGDFLIDVKREWAPVAADRFYNMVKIGYFNEVPFYRVVEGFVAQFGFTGDPAINKVWTDNFMDDDPVKHPNEAGTLVFANRGGPRTRTNQFFINLVDNTQGNRVNLDPMGFAPFGIIVGDGMTVVKSLYSGYGERGPNQHLLKTRGNKYAKASFPNLDYIKSATLVSGD